MQLLYKYKYEHTGKQIITWFCWKFRLAIIAFVILAEADFCPNHDWTNHRQPSPTFNITFLTVFVFVFVLFLNLRQTFAQTMIWTIIGNFQQFCSHISLQNFLPWSFFWFNPEKIFSLLATFCHELLDVKFVSHILRGVTFLVTFCHEFSRGQSDLKMTRVFKPLCSLQSSGANKMQERGCKTSPVVLQNFILQSSKQIKEMQQIHAIV